MSTKTKGPLLDPALCRCCRNIKKCRVITADYDWNGSKEVYSDMFMDCYGLLLSNLDADHKDLGICATCVVRLRDACAFRSQVLQCEQAFLDAQIDKPENQKLGSVEVKVEPYDSDTDSSLDDRDDTDYVDPSESSIKASSDLNIDAGDKKARALRKVRKRIRKKDLLAKVQCLKNKLDSMLQDPDTPVPVKPVKDDSDSQQQALEETTLPNVSTGNDCEDHLDGFASDLDEDSIPLKDYSKRLKRVKSLKNGLKKEKRHKKIDREKWQRHKQMLRAMTDIGDRLDHLQEIDPETRPRPKPRETEQRNYDNITAIVQNSFVCPFDNSFSDFSCFYCKNTFTEPEKLWSHTLTHDPSQFKSIVVNKKLIQIDLTRLDCRLCDEKINDFDTLTNHLRSKHDITITSIDNDILKFKLTASLTCIECGNSFNFFHALKKHMAEHFGSCICDVCGAHYFEERMLILHQKTHQKVQVSFPCTQCDKIFKSKHNRYLHEAKTHKREAAYQCNKCDEVFFTNAQRFRHVQKFHGEIRSYKCSHCDRQYDSRKALREHNRRLHLKILKHQCDLCEKRFYIPSRLKEHMATHTGERNFRCHFCGKSYPRLRGLKVHMQSHTNEKKFRCVLCNASFTQNVNLKNHVKRQHQSLDIIEEFHE